MLQHFKTIWKEFLISYSKIVIKYGVINFKEIHPYDISDAIPVGKNLGFFPKDKTTKLFCPPNFLTASNAYLVTYFPSLDNKPIKNFEQFKMLLTCLNNSKTKTCSKNQKTKNSEEDSEEINSGDSKQNLDEKSSEAINTEVLQTTYAVEKNTTKQVGKNLGFFPKDKTTKLFCPPNPQNLNIKYPTNPIFTTTLSYTNMWPLILLLQNERTCLLSATYSLPLTHSLQKNLRGQNNEVVLSLGKNPRFFPTETSNFFKLSSEQLK